MKPIFILLMSIALLPIACKKETGKIKNSSAAFRPNCLSDYWQQDENYYGDKPSNSSANIPFSLVYNNKVYVFDTGEDEVRFFNGSDWDSIPSSVPFANFDIPNIGFTIGSKGYLGNIDINSLTHPFYEYDFITNTWAPKANFPGVRRDAASAACFAIGNKGYIVGGLGENNNNALTLKDNWQYDPVLDSWQQKAGVPSAGRTAYATGFSIGGKGYVAGGKFITENSTTLLKQLLEYDTASDGWSFKIQFPGAARYFPSVFVISGNGYVGGGRTVNVFYKDFYKYTPASNSWVQVDDITVNNPTIFGFTLNNRGYVEVVTSNSSLPNFLMKYTPKSCIVPITPD